MSRLNVHGLACALAAAFLATSCATAPIAKPSPSSKIEFMVEFRALWWSTEQMEGLNPDTPPPKTKEIVLTRWEYTDPIGIPHPDVFDVVVHVANPSPNAVTGMEVRGVPRWKIGPLENEARAEWESDTPLPTIGPIDIPPGASTVIRFPTIALKQVQDRHYADGRWPWAFEITVSAARRGSPAPVLARETAQLPIRPGD